MLNYSKVKQIIHLYLLLLAILCYVIAVAITMYMSNYLLELEFCQDHRVPTFLVFNGLQ